MSRLDWTGTDEACTIRMIIDRKHCPTLLLQLQRLGQADRLGRHLSQAHPPRPGLAWIPTQPPTCSFCSALARRIDSAAAMAVGMVTITNSVVPGLRNTLRASAM